jgi:hypothetical protein
MYSPKIREELIPVLYRLARHREVPMTRLVDSLLRESLAAYIDRESQENAQLTTRKGINHAEGMHVVLEEGAVR